MYAGDDAFRFRHLLMRDAAYDALPKAERAGCTSSSPTGSGGHGAELVELDELLGYHLEQAYRYQAGVGAPTDTAATWPHGPVSGWR